MAICGLFSGGFGLVFHQNDFLSAGFRKPEGPVIKECGLAPG
jgi:hypothetical protein